MIPTPLRSEVGAVLAAAAVVVGARIGEHSLWAAGLLPACGLVSGLPLAVVLLTRSVLRRRRRALAGLACLAALGAVSMARAVDGLDRGPARLAAAETDATVTVRLAADPQGRWTGVRVPARLERVDGFAAGGTVLVVGKRAAAQRVRLLEAGESAVLTGRFRPLVGAEHRWRWRHASGVFEADDLVGAGPARPWFTTVANGLRHRVLAGGETLGETDRALVAGFLVGDDRDLPPRVAAEFRAAGLSHLLVVSGANVTLALALAAPALRRFGLAGRLVGGVTILILFCAMTRFEPSVLRAGAMSGLALLASFLGRPAGGLRLLALAVTGLVLIDPFLVHSLGFGLSCGASAGILLLAGPLARHLPGPGLLREPLAVTAAAQVGVAPIALPAFGQLPLAALPANLAAAPAAAALSLWGLGSGLAGGVLGGGAGWPDGGPVELLQAPTAMLAGWIRAVAHVAARYPVMIDARTAGLAAAAVPVWWARRALVRRQCSAAGGGHRDECSSGAGAHLLSSVDGRLPLRVRFEPEEVVQGQEARAGDQKGGGRHPVEQVQLEAAPARLAQQSDGPLHLRHDEDELEGGQGAPQAGQEPECQTDPADQLDADDAPGQQLR